MPNTSDAQFAVGQVVRHRRFGYRGVIIDVDATFALSPQWYEAVARSRPPKDKPWYHVLVHETGQQTYVAQRHLEVDPDEQQVDHPDLGKHFNSFRNGRYGSRQQTN